MNLKNSILFAAILLAIGLFVGGWYIFGNFAAKTGATSESNTQTEIKQTFVTALGRIEPADKIVKLTAPPLQNGNGRLAQLFVKEGDEVRNGQIIGELDGKEKQLAAVNEAKKRIEIAERKVAQIKAGAKIGDIDAQRAALEKLKVERQKAEIDLQRARNEKNTIPAAELLTVQKLEAELENARLELNRSDKLFATGDVSKSELDKRRLAFQVAEKSLAEARSNLKSLTDNRRLAVETLTREIARNEASLQSISEVRVVDVNAAQAEVNNAKAALLTAEANLNDLSVKALSGGRVLKINTRAGETISNDGIIEIGETAQMFVVAEVFEEDISKIKLAQTSEMTIRSTGEKLTGEVAEIGWKIGKRSLLDTDPVADIDARVVEVRVRLNPADSLKVANLTNLRVDVRININ